MLKALTLMGGLTLVAAVPVQDDLEAIARYVNAANSSWTAREPLTLVGKSVEETREKCGTWLAGHPNHKTNRELNIPEPTHEELGIPRDLALPDSFDWRANARCASVIGLVRDQSACGSCWAMSASETFTDRRCINANDTKIYSSMDVAGCCKGLFCGMSMGCGGGQQGAALGWISEVGVVTGGNYQDMQKGDSCKGYSFPSCAHHVPPTPGYPACPKAEYHAVCDKKCTDTGYGTSYAADKTKGHGQYAVRGVEKIQQDLMTNGPQAIAFTVYADFETYSSGVYKHTTGSDLGGHAVEMIGWGTDPAGGDYWIVKNSWNDNWGEKGYFRIARGVDECGIESSVFGVHINKA